MLFSHDLFYIKCEQNIKRRITSIVIYPVKITIPTNTSINNLKRNAFHSPIRAHVY